MNWALPDSCVYLPETTPSTNCGLYPSKLRNNTTCQASPAPSASHPVNRPATIMCEYCQSKNSELLIKCIDDNCNRWFCNSERVKGAVSSHIFLHLKKANHTVIELHQHRFCKIGKVKCNSCGNDNVFSLGMLLETHQIYCRQCFISMKLEIKTWKNLVTENKIDTSLINYKKSQKKHPTQKKKSTRIVLISVKEIAEIESKFQIDLTNKDIPTGENLQIYKTYDDIKTFKYIMRELLKLNSHAEQKTNTKNKIKNIIFNLDKTTRQSGCFDGVDYGCKFTLKDKIIITADKFDQWSSKGRLTSVKNGKCFIEFNAKAPEMLEAINMQVLANDIVYKKLKTGLKLFTEKTQDRDVMQIILGQKTKALMDYYHRSRDYSIPGKRRLNDSQNNAVKNAMKYKVSIIQGPPGTGKTETIIAIVYHMVSLWRTSKNHSKQGDKLPKNQAVKRNRDCEGRPIKDICEQFDGIRINEILDEETESHLIRNESETTETNLRTSKRRVPKICVINKKHRQKPKKVHELKKTPSAQKHDNDHESISKSYNSKHKILVCAASNTAVTLLKTDYSKYR